jgi:hypothetical protein
MNHKTYSHTNPAEAQRAFEQDMVAMEDQGLVPQSQEWRVEDIRFRPDVHHLTVTYGPEEEWTGVRIRQSGSVSVRYNNAQEAKAAITELKLYKKELAVKKKELSAQQAQVRAAHTQKTAYLGARRGTGSQLMRGYERQQTANSVAAIGNNKNALDRLNIDIDRLILRLGEAAKGG